jgi:tetratricopeptide (TPR) repeat protein
MITDANRPGQKGYLFNAQRMAANILVQMGDIPRAEGYLRRSTALLQEARTSGLPGWRTNYNIKGRSWEGDVEGTRAIIFEARGQFREAEAAYAKAREWKLAWIPDAKTLVHTAPESQIRGAADGDLLSVGRMKAKQARLAEAEVDTRSALQSRLKALGKYNPQTTGYIKSLANILVEEGRYEEAEKLTRISLEILRTVGVGDDAQNNAQILSQLGAILTFQRKLPEAAAVYAELDKAIAKWEPQRREVLELNGSRINAMFASGQTQAGLAAAQALLKREIARVGEKHFDAASARGILAVGLMRAGRDADAIREFKTALPVLLAASRENADDDDATVVAGRSRRLQGIVEAYIKLLANTQPASGDIAADTFSLADSIRGRTVQQALAASGARASIKDHALTELVRTEQDLGKQVGAQLGLLNNILALPSTERDERRQSRQRLDRQAAFGPRQGPRRNQQTLPVLCRSGRSQAAERRSGQGDAGRGRGHAVVLLRTGCEFCLGRAEIGRGGLRGDQRDIRRNREQGAQAARSARAAGSDDLGHPAVRSETWL